jgi:hypothetical protein
VDLNGLEEVDKAVAAIQSRQEKSLLALPNVLGVGVGRKAVDGSQTHEPCLLVLVSRKFPASQLAAGACIPDLVEHCTTDVIEVGQIAASEAAHPAAPTTVPLGRRVRPAQGGFSVGRPGGPAGSIAGAVIDADCPFGAPRRYYLLGSNSVLAALNEGQAGDSILQPSAADGGALPEDELGRLARFVPLHFDDETNFVDAAVAEVPFVDLDRSVFWLGQPLERAARVRINQVLQKTGRSSQYTTGTVRGVNLTLSVAYGARKARFCQQILTSPLATAGDSGSLVFDSARRAVGLTLAASPFVSVVSPIGLVESLLGICVGW